MSKYIYVCREKVQELAAQNLSAREIAEKTGVKWTLIQKRCRQWGIKLTAPRKPLSIETRALMSKIRKEWCAANPEKHSWKRSGKFKSAPCEKLKEWLKLKSFIFVEEFTPELPEKRYFSIDIAFPEKMVGIEVNGNQHYQPNGQLKPYYQDRHDLIEAAGWKPIIVKCGPPSPPSWERGGAICSEEEAMARTAAEGGGGT